MDKLKLTSLLLRLGLIFIFLYASISALISPEDWQWYIPDWMLTFAPANILLLFHSITELILVGWLIWGKKLFWASLFSALVLAGIILFNLNILGISFRYVGLVVAALALAALHKKDTPDSLLRPE